MKSFAGILLIALIGCGNARVLNLSYEQTPWRSNRNAAYSSRIINGNAADISEFPHMLVLMDLSAGGKFIKILQNIIEKFKNLIFRLHLRCIHHQQFLDT